MFCRTHDSLVHDYIECPACERDAMARERDAAIEKLNALLAEDALGGTGKFGHFYRLGVREALKIIENWDYYGDEPFTSLVERVRELLGGRPE